MISTVQNNPALIQTNSPASIVHGRELVPYGQNSLAPVPFHGREIVLYSQPSTSSSSYGQEVVPQQVIRTPSSSDLETLIKKLLSSTTQLNAINLNTIPNFLLSNKTIKKESLKPPSTSASRHGDKIKLYTELNAAYQALDAAKENLKQEMASLPSTPLSPLKTLKFQASLDQFEGAAMKMRSKIHQLSTQMPKFAPKYQDTYDNLIDSAYQGVFNATKETLESLIDRDQSFAVSEQVNSYAMQALGRIHKQRNVWS